MQASAAVPGYLLVTGWYKDLGVQRAYTAEMTEVIRRYGYQGAAIGMPGVNLAVLEGEWTPRFMILAKFPSGDAVRKFWWSEDYQQAKKLRLGQGYLDVATVDGLPGTEARVDGEAAYLVFFADLKDRKTFLEQYAPFAPAVVARHGGEFVIRADRTQIESLEGDWINASLVVVEFPSVANLKAFWGSEDYQRLSRIRASTGKWSVVEILPMEMN
ncbi:DUF1330 domain-containing protein [Parahaliea maris]|uniref:DUF1330 domain-containing protein n=1 Tax=Parahaliea maris TaxID=2716870 RepID=A0A5C8ZU56_9GAMM|nr:DUF1330 domain-containing protein [Parahaliea maris]TXS91986.1 DUF1330 domain-containing protein [Parahaliea maris]